MFIFVTVAMLCWCRGGTQAFCLNVQPFSAFFSAWRCWPRAAEWKFYKLQPSLPGHESNQMRFLWVLRHICAKQLLINYSDLSNNFKNKTSRNNQNKDRDFHTLKNKEKLMMLSSWRQISQIIYSHFRTAFSPTGPIRVMCEVLQRSEAVHHLLVFYPRLISCWCDYMVQEGQMRWI